MEGKLIKQEDGYYALYNAEGIFISDVNGGSVTNRLSLKNCQEIENGYDLDELVEDNFKGLRACIEDQDIAEFYISLVKTTVTEILGDKKFSEENIINAHYQGVTDAPLYEVIQSLQQTEWDVEVEMEKVKDETKIIGSVKGVKGSGHKITTYKSVPKLDANGCLILKRK